jgi:inosine-uridine nucleoside N-ribohydrolase
MRVHLDTDIGGDIDDLCALALVLAWPDVELTGVTTVIEDGGRRAGYARYALELAGRGAVPVAAGADVRDGHFRERAYGLPPEERYWPAPVPAAPGPVDAALELLAASIDAGAVVIAIGPLTNLALLERRVPGTLARATLCIMGGSVLPAPAGFPAWDHASDFNLQTDAQAAQHVLASADAERTTVVPLEVTTQVVLRRADLPALERAGGAGGPDRGASLASLIARQAAAHAADERYDERYGRRYPALPDDLVNFQHDPLACAIALGWDGARVERVPLAVTIEGGWLRMRADAHGSAVRLATAVDAPAFGALWLDTVTRAGRPADAPGDA